MTTVFRAAGQPCGLIRIDPRTKLFLLLAGNLAVFFAPAIWYEILLAGAILLLGFLCGVYRFSLKWRRFTLPYWPCSFLARCICAVRFM